MPKNDVVDVTHFPKATKKNRVTYKKQKAIKSTSPHAKNSKRSVRINKKGQIVVSKGDKLGQFLEEFINNGGNATRAALKVFNCKSLGSAAYVGNNYLKKAKMAGRVIMEKQGYGLQKMLEVAVEKMEDSKAPDWWDRLMKVGEYEDFMTKKQGGAPGVNVNVFQAHKDYISDYVDGEVDDLNPEEDTKNED